MDVIIVVPTFSSQIDQLESVVASTDTAAFVVHESAAKPPGNGEYFSQRSGETSHVWATDRADPRVGHISGPCVRGRPLMVTDVPTGRKFAMASVSGFYFSGGDWNTLAPCDR